jgi:hypothetical protein
MKTLPFSDGPKHWKQSKTRDQWTRKQKRAFKMRQHEIDAGNVETGWDSSYGGKRSEKCVPIVDASGHTYIVRQSVADALVAKQVQS